MNQPKQAIPSARHRLLDAAESMFFDAGASHLTLEAVARIAGVSKGGLLYHFPSKEALLEGMIDRYMQELGVLAATPEKDGLSPMGPMQAHVHALLCTPGAKIAALLAASAANPALLEPCRAHHAHTLKPFAQRSTLCGDAVLVLVATYGLSVCAMMHLLPLTAEQRGSVIAELVRRAQICDAAARVLESADAFCRLSDSDSDRASECGGHEWR